MEYQVKLLTADVINLNNRMYTLDVMKEINRQINNSVVNVYEEFSDYSYDNLNKIIGRTLKSYIKDNSLYVKIAIRKKPKRKFINLVLTGEELPTEKTGNEKIIVDGFSPLIESPTYMKIGQPSVVGLYMDNNNSYYTEEMVNAGDSNFSFIRKSTLLNEWGEYV